MNSDDSRDSEEPRADDSKLEKQITLASQSKHDQHYRDIVEAARRQARETARMSSDEASATSPLNESVKQTNYSSHDFGCYEVLEEIGRGGMGTVFRARHTRMDRIVALKIMSTPDAHSSATARRFEREVKLLARLNHPNIVAAYDARELGGVLFLVMEWVDGENLRDIVQRSGPLDVERAVHLIVQTADALTYAHAMNVVHRDVKPSNILLDRHQRVKLLDLGLAGIRTPVDRGFEHAGDQITSAGQILGTCDFMAPEQALDASDVDHRADIYSLGCTLYFLLYGKPPYDGASIMQRLLAHREAPVPSLKDVAGHVPALCEVFEQMLAKDPSSRHASMEEVLGRLRTVQAELSPYETAARHIQTADESRREPSQSNGRPRVFARITVAVLGVLLVALALAKFGFYQTGTLVIVADNPRAEELIGRWGIGVISDPDGEAVPRRLTNLKSDLRSGSYSIDTRTVPLGLTFSRTEFHIPRRQPVQLNVTLKRVAMSDSDLQRLETELRQLNPNYDGEIAYAEDVLRPWRQGANDLILDLAGTSGVRDISPLARIHLHKLVLDGTLVTDLSPLLGLDLWYLSLNTTPVDDLSVVGQLSQLTDLFLMNTSVSDLRPLKGLKLDSLELAETNVSDLSPLENMSTLLSLDVSYTPVRNLSPLGMGLKNLQYLSIEGCDQITDLSPLRRFPLSSLQCDISTASQFESLLRALPGLETINDQSADDFWRQLDSSNIE